jgi:hypothetical protein
VGTPTNTEQALSRDSAAGRKGKAKYGQRFARRASRRPLVCLAIPAFDRIAGLNNRYLTLQLEISLTLTVFSHS